MQVRPFGSTGLNLSAIGLGGMPLSLNESRPAEDDAIRLLLRAVELGVTLIDTADSYCIDSSEVGHNEALIGRALRQLPASQRSEVFVATKGGLIRPERRWERDGSPGHLRSACEQSLRRLGVERIDLYQYHRIDPKVPMEDSVATLAELQREGKIRFVGVSNFGVKQLERAGTIVEVVSVQNEYSPLKRTAERPVGESNPALDPDIAGSLEASQKMGMAFLCWCPLGGMGRAADLGQSTPQVLELAADRGVSPQQLALAWELAKGPMVFPIPGARRISSLESSAAAADLKLGEDEMRLLDEAWAG